MPHAQYYLAVYDTALPGHHAPSQLFGLTLTNVMLHTTICLCSLRFSLRDGGPGPGQHWAWDLPPEEALDWSSDMSGVPRQRLLLAL